MRAPPALLPTLVLALAAGLLAPAAAQPVPALALTPEQLAVLPQHQLTLPTGTPPAPHSFEGPLVWDVLAASGTIDPARHADAVRQWLVVRGADGYAAVLALAEIAPDFENKPVLLAFRMDGTDLDHPRLVVPAERRPGRSVRDVAALGVESLPDRPR